MSVDDLDQDSTLLGPLVTLNVSGGPNVSLQLAAAYYLTADSEISDSTGSITADGTGFEVGGNVLYFITDSVAASFGVSFTSLDQEVNNVDLTTDGTAFGAGITVLIE
jgi:hypothetical protein